MKAQAHVGEISVLLCLALLTACSRRSSPPSFEIDAAPAGEPSIKAAPPAPAVVGAVEPTECRVIGEKPFMLPGDDMPRGGLLANGWAPPYDKDARRYADDVVKEFSKPVRPGTRVHVILWAGEGHQGPDQGRGVLPFAHVRFLDSNLKGTDGVMLGRFLEAVDGG